MRTTPRDHGGNLDEAMSRYGGTRADWLDLSTGINPVHFPLPPFPANSWGALPTKADLSALIETARAAYDTPAAIVALAGAQAAIQLVPRLGPAREARILGPTYNEHAAALAAQGWTVRTVTTLAALEGADLAIVVNPNNPDGQHHKRETLIALSASVGLLVVDESFADPVPDQSLAPYLTQANIVVLRSFGKFYGLAGVRLGFALGPTELIDQMRNLAGPWSVSGPAIACGRAALANTRWQAETTALLIRDAERLDQIAHRAGWQLVGGTPLFRTYATPDAKSAQKTLALHQVWSRIFPYSKTWLRLGLPAPEGWARLERAFATLR